jgi:hypothetical protein
MLPLKGMGSDLGCEFEGLYLVAAHFILINIPTHASLCGFAGAPRRGRLIGQRSYRFTSVGPMTAHRPELTFPEGRGMAASGTR